MTNKVSSSMVDYLQGGTGSTTRSLESKLGDVVSVMDFGGVADGSTDNVAAILLAAAASNTVFIPANVLYNKTTLLASLPTDTVLLDMSGINDFSAAGETSKTVGILSSDEAVSDTHWAVSSDHHAITTLNNFGGAGSASADGHFASLLWAAGQFQTGAADKRGFRGAAIQQFGKGSGDYWQWGIRSIAPWDAIDGQYERWVTGVSVTSGDYRENGGNHYVSGTTGTTGATAPVHTSGTVSDGTVDWTYVDGADRSVITIDEYGRTIIGAGSFANQTFLVRPAPTDPAAGTCNVAFECRGASKNSSLKLTPTDAGSALSPQPYLLAQDGVGLRIMDSAGSTDLGTFSDSGGFIAREFRNNFTAAADADTTPSVAGVSTLFLANTGATSVTTLDDASDGQIVHLIFGNANTTLVSAATFLLTGSVNVTPTTYSSVTMFKVPSGTSDRWIEIGRSIK